MTLMRAAWLLLLGGCDVVFTLRDPPAKLADGGTDASNPLGIACPIDEERLLACYGFDDTVLDQSGNGNHPSEIDIAFDEGIDKRALRTTEGSRLALMGHSITATNVTIEAWVFPDVVAREQVVMDHDVHWGMTLDAFGRLSCFDMAATPLVADAPIPSAAWVHIACTYDGARLTGFVDGSSIGDRQAAPLPATELPAAIASDAPGHTSPFVGRIDRLRVWNVVLTNDEIATAAGRR